MTKEILLIQQQSKFIDKLYKEIDNKDKTIEVLNNRLVATMENRNKYKILFENLQKKVKGLCDEN